MNGFLVTVSNITLNQYMYNFLSIPINTISTYTSLWVTEEEEMLLDGTNDGMMEEWLSGKLICTVPLRSEH